MSKMGMCLDVISGLPCGSEFTSHDIVELAGPPVTFSDAGNAMLRAVERSVVAFVGFKVSEIGTARKLYKRI